MSDATELRRRAGRWRQLAEVTRGEVVLLRRVREIAWRGSSAAAFRDVLGRRVEELVELAEREDSVADLLDRVAAAVEQAA
ncbi:hypothetical protein ACOCJ4_00470 [Knoellia sp. CPCC 206435]|uniref:hypothetical protein n=1 Tax=Knoellia terrae TaxID=3404797 RepID=UPI003B432788